MIPKLISYQTPGALAERSEGNSLKMRLPAGPAVKYRWAQFDDYHHLSRKSLPWQPPLRISLQARCSLQGHAGTWGFGLWNDPFSANLGLGGMARRIPAAPNCAWFFYASPSNHLEIHDRYPANGFLAATFRSPNLPGYTYLPFYLFAPLLAIPVLAKWARIWLRAFVQQDAVQLAVDITQWHSYQLDWTPESAAFGVDGKQVFSTAVSPRGNLGLVIWIDNQYAAFPADGRIRFGTLAQGSESQLEVKDLETSLP
jgi:hypothetical protein